MPTRDRHWRAQLIGGLVTMMVACALGVALVVSQLQLFQVEGYSLGDLLSPPRIHWLILPLLGSTAMLGSLVLRGYGLWRDGRRAHVRYQGRVAAMRGDPSAMPLAREQVVAANPADAPDLRGSPLALTWRHTTIAYRVYVPLFGLAILVFLALAGLPLFLFWLAATTPTTTPPPLWGWIILYGVIGFLLVASLLVVGLFTRELIDLRHPRGVVVTEEGIAYYTAHHPPRLLRWEDLRLFEIATPDRPQSSSESFYVLHGLYGEAQWVTTPRNTAFITYDAPNDELARRQQALLDLIAARTGLRARTFAATMQQRDEQDADAVVDQQTEQPSRHTQQTINLVLFIVCLLIIGPSAALIVIGGMTTSPLMNLIVAGALLSLLLAVALGALRAYLRDRSSNQQPDPTMRNQPPNDSTMAVSAVKAKAPPSVVALADGHVTLAFAEGISVGAYLGLVAVSLAMSVCALPELSATIAWLGARVAPLRALTSAAPTITGNGIGLQGVASQCGAIVLAAIGVLGCFMLCFSIVPYRAVLSADATGLYRRHRRKTTQLAWRQIAEIEAQRTGGGYERFTVTNSGASVSITWQADPNTHRSLTTRDIRGIGTPIQPITAHELAALVVKRSRVALIVHGGNPRRLRRYVPPTLTGISTDS